MSSVISSFELREHLSRNRVANIIESNAANDPFAKPFNYVATLGDRLSPDALDSAAVAFGDDHVLRDVNKAPGQITRIRGLERSVRQTLARAVR